MNVNIVREFLTHIELFKDLDSEERNLLLAEVTEMTLKAVTLLFEENTTR